MDYSPERDDAFEEGERKSRGKFTWRKRLRQLAAVVRCRVGGQKCGECVFFFLPGNATNGGKRQKGEGGFER